MYQSFGDFCFRAITNEFFLCAVNPDAMRLQGLRKIP